MRENGETKVVMVGEKKLNSVISKGWMNSCQVEIFFKDNSTFQWANIQSFISHQNFKKYMKSIFFTVNYVSSL